MGLDLRPNLIAQATTNAPIEEILDSGQRRLLAEAPKIIDNTGEPLRRQHAEPAANHQMQANVEPPMCSRNRRRLVACSAGNHQAGGGEYACVERADNGSIHFARKPKVVGGDNYCSRRILIPQFPAIRTRHDLRI